jgi:FdhE protein
MATEFFITVDQLKKAVAFVKKSRPAYKKILSFYEKIFTAQERSKKKLPSSPVSIPPELATIKHKEGFPLISLSEFVVDIRTAEMLFNKILDIAAKTKGQWAGFSNIISRGRSGIDLKELINNYLGQEDLFFSHIAEEEGVDPVMLGMAVYHSIRPSVEHNAAQLATLISEDSSWEKGYCPICGSQAGLSVLKEEGRRNFICHFCYHRWTAQRIYCPYCQNRDGEHLHYIYAEEEKGYRIDICDSCRMYIKTVDIRELDHAFYPPLEQISTLHLDMKANEKGYHSPLLNQKGVSGESWISPNEY